jgi:NADH:ubiquinone reductase (H+-translocating)
MRDVTDTLRRAVRQAFRFGSAIRTVSNPWLLLACRLWLGQLTLIRAVMVMMAGIAPPGSGAETGHDLSAILLGLEGLFDAAGPLLLMAGLLTRPVASALVVQAVWSALEGHTAAASMPALALLVWLIVNGPGPLSVDQLLGRGLIWSAIRPAHAISRLYAHVTRLLEPCALMLIRLGIAAAIVAPEPLALTWQRSTGLQGMSLPELAGGWLILFAGALILGAGTALVALALASMIPLVGITMAMDDRLTLLLVFLILATAGAGRFSLDRLISAWASRLMDSRPDATTLPHVIVVGGGFAGVATVRGLRNAQCRITLIDRRNYHLFQPLLYQVATAALSPAEIATPIRSLFREQGNVRVCLAEVVGVDTAAREVVLKQSRIRFDYLVLATGAQHSYFGEESWADFAPGLKTVENATAIRSRLLRALEEAENATDDAQRTAWLKFVVVGSGPTGVELAGAIAELAHHGMDREYRSIDPTVAQVILIQAGPRILPTFAPALSAAAERSLRALGVDARIAAKVRQIDAEGVEVGEQRVPTRTVLWAAGVTASPAAQWLGRPADSAGRLIVGPDLSVPGLPGVFGVGDTVACEAWRGGLTPGLAPAAKQAGNYVARVIQSALAGQAPPPRFRYRHLGSLATVGRQAAVVELGPLHVSGAAAWWFWGAAHVAFLVGGRNRVTVVLDWFWAYLTYRRSTRLITGEPPMDVAPVSRDDPASRRPLLSMSGHGSPAGMEEGSPFCVNIQ